MRNVLLLVPVLLLSSCLSMRAPTPSAAPAHEVPSTLRVITYNIRAGNDLQRRPSLPRVAALLDSLAADIVFLQEVDRGTARSGAVDQMDDLTRRTGLQGAFGSAMDFDGGEYGTGLLTRLPLRRAAGIPLPVTVPIDLRGRPYEPRSLLHAIVDSPAGPIHLLGTHLDHQGEPWFRHSQLFQILAYLGETIPVDARVIFAGDLNAEPNAPEIRSLSLYFDDTWTACGSGAGLTYPADRPVRRIDYVLVRGLRCTAATVVDTQVSDHRPVVVELTW